MGSNISIESIHIYPIKGMKGISRASALADVEGFQFDRRMMLVDHEGNFISQRQFSKLSMITTSIEDEGIGLRYGDLTSFIPFETAENKLINTKVWSSKLKAQIVGDEWNLWFSDVLQQEVYLVKMNSDHKRYKRLFVKPFKTYVSFADGYPFLTLGTASMVELNKRLSDPVRIDRFRANIVLNTESAHEEDDWSEFQLGDAHFKNIKPCARCEVVTIDQQSGIRSAEPLKTLAKYRRQSNKVFFGSNVICLKPGIVQVGDQLKRV